MFPCSLLVPCSDQIEQHFAIRSPQFDLPPEAWPGYMAPIICASHDVPGELEVAPACCGMVPHWADMKLARQTYNARTETVAQKPSFRNAWKRKQFCIIPADNFFEPCYETGKPVRWRIERIERADRMPAAIAGIWEFRPQDLLLSFSMLTINADVHSLMQRFHKPDDEKGWKGADGRGQVCHLNTISALAILICSKLAFTR